MRKTIWHEIKESEKISLDDTIATDIHIRWLGGKMDVSCNGDITKGELIGAIRVLLQELEKGATK